MEQVAEQQPTPAPVDTVVESKNENVSIEEGSRAKIAREAIQNLDVAAGVEELDEMAGVGCCSAAWGVSITGFVAVTTADVFTSSFPYSSQFNISFSYIIGMLHNLDHPESRLAVQVQVVVLILRHPRPQR